MENEKVLSDLKKFASKSNSHFGQFLNRVREDLEFAGGKQFTKMDRDSRGTGRAEFTFNIVRNYCNQIINGYRKKPFGIVVTPRKSSDKDKAIVCQALIRGWESQQSAVDKYTYAIDRQVKAGIGYVLLSTDYIGDSWDQDIKIQAVLKPDMVIYDPFSVEVDGSDATRCALVEHISSDKAAQLTGKNPDDFKYTDSVIGGTRWQAPDGSVELVTYFNLKKNTKKIHLLKDGTTSEKDDINSELITRSRDIIKTSVEVYKIIGQDVISETELNISSLPIIPFKGELIDKDSKQDWAGIVYFAKDPARLINWTASLTAERIAISPKPTIFTDFRSIAPYKDIWQRANRIHAPFLPFNSTSEDGKTTYLKPEASVIPIDIDTPSKAQSNYQSLLSSVIGMSEAGSLQNGPSNETAASVLTRDRSSETGNYQYMDNASKSIRAIGRVWLELAGIIYDTDRIMPMVDNGSVNISNINYKNIGVIPSELYVDVEAGPMQATQRKDEQSQLLALGSLLGQEASFAIAPYIADTLDIASSDSIKTALRNLATSKGITDPDAQQSVDSASIAQINDLSAKLQQSQIYIQQLQNELQSSRDIANAQIATAQINAQNRIDVEAMKQNGALTKEQMRIQADAQSEAQKAINETNKNLEDISKKPVIVIDTAHTSHNSVGGLRNRI